MRRIAQLGAALAIAVLAPASASAWTLDAQRVYPGLLAVASDGSAYAAVTGPALAGATLHDTMAGTSLLAQTDAPVAAIAADPDGGWLLALDGAATTLRRLGADGQPDATFASPLTGPVTELAVAGGNAFVADRFRDPSSPDPMLRAVDARTGAVRPWAPVLDGTVLGLAAAGGTVYVAGRFTTVDGQPRPGVAAFDATTLALLPFAPTGLAFPSASRIAAGPTHLVVAGDFEVGPSIATLVAIDRATGAATALLTSDQDGDASIEDVAVEGSTVVVGGRFTTLRGQPRNGAAALDVTTGQLLPWNPWLEPADDVRVARVAVANGVVTLVGDFARVRGKARPGAARVSLATGTPTSWAPAGVGPTALGVAGALVLAPSDLRDASGIVGLDAAGRVRWLVPVEATAYRLATDGSRVFVGIGNRSVARRTLLVTAVAADSGAALWQASLRTPRSPGLGSRAIGGSVVSLVPDGSELLVLARFATSRGTYAHVVARLDAATGRVLLARAIPTATPFPGPRDANGRPPFLEARTIAALAPHGGRIYLGGALQVTASVRGTVRGRPGIVTRSTSQLVALDRRTGRLLPWRPDALGGWRGFAAEPTIAELTPSEASRLLVVGDRLVVVGRFASVGRARRTSGVAVLSLPSGRVTAVDPRLGLTKAGTVRGIAACGGTLLLTGDFRRAAGQPRPGAAAFDLASGALAPWTGSAPDRLDVLRAAGSTVVATGQRGPGGAALIQVASPPGGAPCVSAEGGPEAPAREGSEG